MIISVVSDLVSFVHDSPDQRRILFRVYADHEERRLRIRRFQNIQDLRRPIRVRAVVKSQRDLMLAARALMIKRRKLRKLYHQGAGGEHQVALTFDDGPDPDW